MTTMPKPTTAGIVPTAPMVSINSAPTNRISIGELAKRSGVAASALRFYEDEGLIESTRTQGQQRQFKRDVLRRVAFIRVAQTVGLSLQDIRDALASLPLKRTPTQADWARLSSAWQPLLDNRIQTLIRLRDQLSSCIGCGCLSLKVCALYNPNDAASSHGSGPRYLLGDKVLGNKVEDVKARRTIKKR
jgi:MerR family transcriptional regulator, redox-sensitive transcriptional activator SoxR